MSNQKWQSLIAEAFASFPDERIIREARETLGAMGYHVEQDDLWFDIPHDVHLLVVRRSLHSDREARWGDYLTFDVAIGPHFTDLGRFNGVCDYGVLRLQFGLDGAFQDDAFIISPQLQPEAARWEYQQVPLAVAMAEKREEYKNGESDEPESDAQRPSDDA